MKPLELDAGVDVYMNAIFEGDVLTLNQDGNFEVCSFSPPLQLFLLCAALKTLRFISAQMVIYLVFIILKMFCI